MTPAQIEYKYRNRMSLSPEERAEIERLYEEMLSGASAQWSGATADRSPSSLDPNDAAAVEIGEDPSLIPVGASGKPLTADDVGPEMKADPSLLPPVEEPEPQAAVVAPARPERDDWVARRAAELVRRGRPLAYSEAAISPESARAQAEAEYDDPNGWSRSRGMSPQVRAAVSRQADIEGAKRAADLQASLRGEPQFNARDFMRQREEEAAAKEADAQRKWDEWTTGGSLERMARYAPDEFKRREDAARELRWKENRQAYQNRWDPTIDEKTGKSKGELYRIAQNQQDKERLARTAPQANRALARQLEQMGIDSKQFGDWRSDSFAREGALDAKNRAMASGELGGRYGAVQRRAQLRQNPMEYMGRPDVSDAQRRTLALLMSGGRGATANDVEALNAKMLLEGIGQGVDRGMRIGNMDMKEELAAMQLQEQRMQRAAQEADAFYAKRRGWGGSLDAAAYDDLIAMLSGMGLSDAQAQGLARRYKRSGGRAERTAPPAK